MRDRGFYFILATIILLASLPLLVRLGRALASPWRTLAARYPGPGPECQKQVSYVTARFWGRFPPFSLVRTIRLRATEDFLCLSVLGLDFSPVTLPEIVIPRSAVTECAACNFLISRQSLTLEDAPVRIIIYGRGATFLRAWWEKQEGRGHA